MGKHGTGLTKMISKLSKEGAYRKSLEVFYTLAEMDIAVDTAVVNAAISATDRGQLPSACRFCVGTKAAAHWCANSAAGTSSTGTYC